MPLEARPLFTLDVTVSTRPLAVSSAVSSSTLRVSSALTLNSSALRRSRTGSPVGAGGTARSEEHTSELQSLMRISYAVFCLKKKKTNTLTHMHVNRYNKHFHT